MPPSRSLDPRPVDLADEALARGPDHQRPPQLPQLPQPPQQLQVVLQRLAEPDPRIEPDPLLGDALRHGELQPLGEKGLDVVDDVVIARIVLHRPRIPRHVHEHDADAPLSTQRRHLQVPPQTPSRR